MNIDTMTYIFGLTPYKAAALKDIFAREVEFIDDAIFSQEDAEKVLFESEVELPSVSNWKGYDVVENSTKVTKEDRTVLSAEQEALLFRQYNYARKRVIDAKEELKVAPRKSLIEEAIKWHTKALRICNLLTEMNMRLVVNIVKKFSIYNLDLDDLYSDAHWALVSAVNKFDVSKGNKFSTYAQWSIVRALGKVNKHRSRRNDLAPVSLDDENVVSLEIKDETIANEKHKRENLYYLEALNKIIEKNLAGLSDVELSIIRERYLANDKKVSISEISKKLQLKSHQVDKSEKSALRKIRAVIEKNF